jgi:hypothetical protein
LGDCSSFGGSSNGWALGGAGRVTWWWAPNYSIQVDDRNGTTLDIIAPFGAPSLTFLQRAQL